MNKRIRKKLYKKYLDDVRYEISVSDEWRKVLFNNDFDLKFLIDINTTKNQTYLFKILNKYSFKYYVSKLEFNDKEVVFKFESVEFNNIYNVSYNPINTYFIE
jgi:hypothetical protein